MAHEVPWSKIILETFIEEALLTEREEKIMRTRVAGWTIKEQAYKLGLSESTVKSDIAKIKQKYDQVSKYNPILPPRKHSAEEDRMDNN